MLLPDPEEAPRTTQSVYRSVEEKFDALQDEVSLLKCEIRQSLVDLREFMMKGRTNFLHSTPEPQATGPTPAPVPPIMVTPDAQQAQQEVAEPQPPAPPADESPVPAASRPLEFPDLAQYVEPRDKFTMDTNKMANIIKWIGQVKRRGPSAHHVRPFLEAYELSGHLTPAMAELTFRSLSDLQDVDVEDYPFTPEEYSQCLLELHQIVSIPGYVQNAPAPYRWEEYQKPSHESVEAQEKASGSPSHESVSAQEHSYIDPLMAEDAIG